MQEKVYKPELGQILFGCPASEYACPEFIEAGLDYLARRIETSEWNRAQEEFVSPIYNSGTHYETDVFEMHSYYWGGCSCDADEDEECKSECLLKRPNFKCGDFEVRWYKYVGRGMSMNQDIDANEFFEIIDRCLASVPSNCEEL